MNIGNNRLDKYKSVQNEQIANRTTRLIKFLTNTEQVKKLIQDMDLEAPIQENNEEDSDLIEDTNSSH